AVVQAEIRCALDGHEELAVPALGDAFRAGSDREGDRRCGGACRLLGAGGHAGTHQGHRRQRRDQERARGPLTRIHDRRLPRYRRRTRHSLSCIVQRAPPRGTPWTFIIFEHSAYRRVACPALPGPMTRTHRFLMSGAAAVAVLLAGSVAARATTSPAA